MLFPQENPTFTALSKLKRKAQMIKEVWLDPPTTKYYN